MKIAVVSDYLDPLNWGGAARVAAAQAREFTRGGHEVLLLGASTSLGRVEGCHHVAFEHRAGLKGVWSLRRHVRSHLGLFRPELVIAHQPLVARFVLELFPRVPLRYVFHSSWVAEVESRGGRPGMRKRVECKVLRKADKIFCTSPFTLGELERTEPSARAKARVSPLAVECPPFVPDPGRRDWVKRRYEIPEGFRVVTVFRRLTSRTGVDLALEAAGRTPGIFLLVGGTGELASELAAHAGRCGLAGRSRFLGYVPEGQMITLLQGTDAVMVPSRELEGFGLATLEAMACGTPVAATDVGNNRNLVEGCLGGELSLEVSATGLSKALEAVLGKTWDKKALGQRAREAYSWTRHARELLC